MSPAPFYRSPMPDLAQWIATANAARAAGRVAIDAEQELESRFRTSETLAVYGTLAPGQPNHHLVEPRGGLWTSGLIEGDLHPTGWGAILGYPAFRPRTGGAVVAVQLLVSAALPEAWAELDAFEGPEYLRILVPVFDSDRRLITVANLYAINEMS